MAGSAPKAPPLEGTPPFEAVPGDPPAKDRTIGPAQDRLADFVHASLIQNIVMADRKAGILFTLVSAALLFLFTRVPGALSDPSGALWALVVAVLVLSAACAFSAIFPRIRNQGDSLLFWGAMARHKDRDSYIDEVCGQSYDGIARRKLGYCHDLACICARKYRLLRIAMVCAALGLVLFLALLALGVPTALTGNARSLVW